MQRSTSPGETFTYAAWSLPILVSAFGAKGHRSSTGRWARTMKASSSDFSQARPTAAGTCGRSVSTCPKVLDFGYS
jgi:hypothetical protein